MTKELEDKFFNRFFFYRPELPMSESLMCFGFECGDGWGDLLWDLSEKIEKEIFKSVGSPEAAKALLSDTVMIFNVVQVKEKFGTLRFYVDAYDEITEESYKKIRNYIHEAEAKSAITCEVCGKPGERRSGGWIKCLCESCHEDK